MKRKLNRYGVSPPNALLWAEGYESSRTYLAKVNGDRSRQAQYLYFYCSWAKLNPDELSPEPYEGICEVTFYIEEQYWKISLRLI